MMTTGVTTSTGSATTGSATTGSATTDSAGFGTPATRTPAAAPRERRALPGTVAIGITRGLAEVRVLFRNRPALVMNMALPVALMLLFGSIFTMKDGGQDVSVHGIVVAGVLASGVMSAAFGTMAMGIALDATDGTRKRLHGTPFGRASYFIAKAVLALVQALVQLVIVLTVARIAFGFPLPATPAKWFTFLWVFVLGSLATALLGIAVGSLVTDRRGIAAAIQFPFVILQFISGIYYTFSALPAGVQHVGAFFPLKWLAQGMRAALLPDGMARFEPTHQWELGRIALVLAAWIVAGFLLCLAATARRLRKDSR